MLPLVLDPGNWSSIFGDPLSDNGGLLLTRRLAVTEPITIGANAGDLPSGLVLGKKVDGTYAPSALPATDGSQVPCAVLTISTPDSTSPTTSTAYVAGEFVIEKIIFDESWVSVAALIPLLSAKRIYLKGSY